MYKLAWVGLGGSIGAILRYLISGWVQNLTQSIGFPYGTLVVNILGCFFIGVLSYLAEYQSAFTAEMRLFLMVGILGAFTTYSTFSNETMNLLQDQRVFQAFLNVTLHVVLGLSAVMLGRLTVITLWR